MSFRCRCISETSCRLKGIFKSCTIQADICKQPDTDVEIMSNGLVAESILCDFDRALLTLSFFVFLEISTFTQRLSSTRQCLSHSLKKLRFL